MSGIRVLDLSRVLAGPWATQLLADLGADVIKIERPGAGDDTRNWGPPWFTGPDGAREAAYFICANRGKRSVAIDISTAEGSAIVKELAATSDVVVENYKRGDLARYGLDAATLRAAHPHLIYCSISGFGESGPYADLPGYDFLIQAMGGMMSLTGEPDGLPCKTGVALTDILTGLYAANGIQAALHQRHRTGVGQLVEVALMDVQIAALANQASGYLATGNNPARHGNAHPSIVPYQGFETKDGMIAVAVGNDRQFRQLCAALDCVELAEDPRFAGNAARVTARTELTAILSAKFRDRTTGEWTGALRQAGVPAGPVNSIEEVFADPHVQARGIAVEMPHATLGSVAGVACPVKLSASPVSYDRGPPALDEHGDDIRRVSATRKNP